ncbi:hypothetical protein Tsubulata_007504 [Turnera subulata]|uniref:Uncharacterized protein n=1 Tax=Turnera subulata TaxID=218843 RepID=A0A9Q0FZ35_9ROSI|nr:hypothetical protein Tsubulata_007504 [Turnera subulata]
MLALNHPQYSQVDKNEENIGPIMSVQEMKIRDELEMDIENDLEQEIKDGICHLALRLHRLYLHQKERKARKVAQLLSAGAKNHQADKKHNKTLSQVNIAIRLLEGGTKIEIKETKKEVPEKGSSSSSRPQTPRSSSNLQGMHGSKKFDWERSLRSSSSSSGGQVSPISKRQLNLDDARRNPPSAAGMRKSNINNGVHNNVIELGWKC